MKSFASFPLEKSPVAKKRKKHHKKDIPRPPPIPQNYIISSYGDATNVQYKSSHGIEFKRHTRCVLGASCFKVALLGAQYDERRGTFYSQLKQSLKGPATRLSLASVQVDAGGPKTYHNSSSSSADFLEFPLLDLEAPVQIELEDSKDFILKTGEYSQRLFNDPKNTALWIEYIEFQETLAASNGAVKRKNTRMHDLINEKKLAIYERAILENRGNVMLIRGYLDCLQDSNKESSEINDVWVNVLANNPESVDLYSAFTEWKIQDNFSSAAVEDSMLPITRSIEHVVRTNRRIVELAGAANTTPEFREKCEIRIVGIFARLMLLLAQAGYIERCVASFQALIEFTCALPPAYDGYIFTDRVRVFEEFWESEIPRLGELNALGWKNSVMRDIDALYLPEHILTLDSSDGSLLSIPYSLAESSWGKTEIIDAHANWLPQRTASAQEQSVNDPYRCILFNDIEPLLVNLHSQAAKASLLDAFVEFLMGGLSIDSRIGTFCSGWGVTKCRDLSAYPLKELLGHGKTTFPYHASSDFSCSVDSTFPSSQDIAFIPSLGVGWYEFLRYIMDWLIYTLSRQTLVQRVQLDDRDSQPLVLYLTLESRITQNIKSSRKCAKSLLKTRPQDFRLWNAYALIEIAAGNVDEARKVYSIAISFVDFRAFDLSSIAAQNGTIDITALFLANTEFELSQGILLRALAILVAFAERVAPTAEFDENATDIPPIRILKAQKAYMELLCRGTTANALFQLVFSLAAYFEYVKDGVDAAYATFQLSLRLCDPAGQESLYTQIVKLIIMHHTLGNKSSGFRPNLLRDTLLAGLQIAPNNTYLLGCLVASEKKNRVENRVALTLDQLTKRHRSNTLWTFYAWYVSQAQQVRNSNLIRSVLDSAVDSLARRSPDIWFLYIMFEIQEGDYARAKSLVFRAIKECPWCKDLYLFSCIELYNMFSEAELNQIGLLMEEKEIRMRNMFPLNEEFM